MAAEAAVSSPLLEHVDLADAHGILVNVTAGMDMSIGEFQEVGNIVKEFASDDATVVVGTVIDPEMKDELRVTVVATGLNRTAQQGRGRDGFRDAGRDRDYGRDRDDGREIRRDARESGREGMRVVKRPAVAAMLAMTTRSWIGPQCSAMPAPWAMAWAPRHRWMRNCWIFRHSCVARPTDRAVGIPPRLRQCVVVR